VTGRPGFDSLGISCLLHCLPGPLQSKAVAFDHLKALLNPGGVLFGATVLRGGVARGPLARVAMRYCNARKIFSNDHDDLDGLRQALAARFAESSVRTVGCIALFWGRS
jgi:hypothetical protein